MSAADKNLALNSGDSYCRFGCDVLDKLLKGFQGQIGGVIDNKDVECVHKMRVSTRKIRAVLPLFRRCYPKKKYKQWLKEIKKVTKLLSEARDLDVQITFLQNYLQKDPQHQALAPLLKDHKDRRKTVQATVTEGLENLESSDMLPELSLFLKQQVNDLSRVPFDALSVLEKACWNMTCMLDDLLVLSCFVHQESAILKHHEMRIKAKRLRYTMETFAPLYKTGLKQEIQQMKSFQDLLGEMHDCDVWLVYLSTFSEKEKSSGKTLKSPELQKAITDFSTFVTVHKKSNYDRFVKLWDEAVEQNFFDNLRKTIHVEAGFAAKNLAYFSNPNLKVAVVSDIHANLHAFETVILDAEKRGATVFLNAGDSVGYGACPTEVIKLLYEKNVVSVLGNFDVAVFKNSSKNVGAKKVAVNYVNDELSKPCKAYLRSFPPEVKLEIGGKKVFMTHASPKSPTEHITTETPDARLKKILVDTDSDVIILGHSHEQFQRQIDGVSFVNPGSVGRPGDGTPQTAYALLSFNPFYVELVRLDYPVEAAAEALRRKGLPENFSQMLLSGRPIETIDNEDKTKTENTQRDWNQITQTALDFSKSCLQDTAHPEYVRVLALGLFDNLKSLHQLGDCERRLLEWAALLHDLGLSKGVKGHHKTSMFMILNAAQLPLTSEERRIVASIARYHRKGLPKQKHYNLSTLNRKTIETIAVLSSILRVADALDYLHVSDVKLVSVNVASKKVTIECTCPSDTSLVDQAFDKKKDLFEIFFKKKLVLTWNKR